MKDDRLAELYELYLASIEEELSLDAEMEAYAGDKQIMPSGQVLGSIRNIVDLGKEISYLVYEHQPGQGYRALKTSCYIQFGAEVDSIARGEYGDLLVELDNEFLLSELEVLSADAVDWISPLSLLELEKARQDLAELDFDYQIDSYKRKFKIKELELTVSLRSRNDGLRHPISPMPMLLQAVMANQASLMAAKNNNLAHAFALLKQPQDGKVYYADGYTLRRENNKVITLHTDPCIKGRLAEIYVGVFIMFRGPLPQVLAMNISMSLAELHEYLDIKLVKI